jgi:hypothetical protein
LTGYPSSALLSNIAFYDWLQTCFLIPYFTFVLTLSLYILTFSPFPFPVPQLMDQASALAAMKISLSEEQEANEVLKEQKAGLMQMVVRVLGHSLLSYYALLPSYLLLHLVRHPFFEYLNLEI